MNTIYKLYKNIIEYIKYQYYLDSDSKKINNNTATNSLKENSISFKIDEWNRFFINVHLDIDNDKSCEEFGKMLFFLQNNRYEQNIVDTIVDMATKKYLKTENVQKVMSGWTTLLVQEIGNKNTPYVKPTEVFKHNA